MQKVIGVSELEQRLESVLDEVSQGHVSYVLEDDSRPEAAIIPYEDFLRYQQLRIQAVNDRLDRLEERVAASDDDAQVAAEIAAAVADGVPDVLARLSARKMLNARLDWDPRDSTDILRKLRQAAR